MHVFGYKGKTSTQKPPRSNQASNLLGSDHPVTVLPLLCLYIRSNPPSVVLSYLLQTQNFSRGKDKSRERPKAADAYLAFITTLTPSFPPRLPPLPPRRTQALKHRPASSNEPEVTPLLRLWQGLPRWKLDDLEAACRCGESGRGVRPGMKLAVPARRGQLTAPHNILSQAAVSQFLKSVWVT